MSDLSDYGENVLIGQIPSTLYVALFSSDPTETGTAGTEVTTTIRPTGRVQATLAPAAAGSNIRYVTNLVDFGTSNGNTTITHAAMFDAQTGGNMWVFKALSANRTITTGTPVRYQPNTLTVALN